MIYAINHPEPAKLKRKGSSSSTSENLFSSTYLTSQPIEKDELYMDEKPCPYCAETIKAAAIKCRFCDADLSKSGWSRAAAANPPAPLPTPTVASCTKCNMALVPAQVRKFASLGGCLGALLFLVGIVLCLTVVGLVGGIIFMAVGVIVSSIGGKKTVMVCPHCGAHGRTIAG
jgi:hypothetical protein